MNRRSACLLLASSPVLAAEWLGESSSSAERPWIGPEFWSNPLQDWRLKNNRIECIVSGGNRNVYLLTREIAARTGALAMRVDLGRMEDDPAPLSEGFAGFRLGVKGKLNDYRDSALYGIGLHAGVSCDGRLFIGNLEHSAAVPGFPLPVRLAMDAQPDGSSYRIQLAALDLKGRTLASLSRSGIAPEWLEGGVALVCSSGPVGDSPNPSCIGTTMSGFVIANSARQGNVRFWFRDWEVSGSKVDRHDDRAFGPILWSMYTLTRGVLKLAVQMAPVENRSEPVRLQVQRNGAWKTVASASIDPLARTATFRVPKWPSNEDVRYRAAYSLNGEHFFEGTVRRDPVDKPKIVVASLSCLNDFGFPHSDLLSSIQHLKPDLAAFQGDQIYERCAGYGIQRFPLETATLDYLRKWYLFGWSFRDVMREVPVVCMPDDHDVYHGNVWGAGGRHAEGLGQDGQDSGGYIEPASWVNMIQRTQTSHLPDPYDPTPVEQNIAVYYTELRWGGISFAILEDRKWKSAPKVKIPFARIKNGWAQNPDYNPARDGDVAGAELLGPRQLSFLDHWAQDWSGGTWLKVALSQTLLANVATLPPPANTDAVVPRLPILKAGEYAEGDMVVADHDSNGWPQSGRNRALEALRKCAALHLCGDQHLGSTVQYGVDKWGDAAFGVCSPALSNIFPRRWYPPHPGKNPLPYEPRNTGDYVDGFGNKITVHAVFNPEQTDAEPNPLMDRSPGIAMIELDRADLSASVSIWARRVNPQSEGAKPVKGWPIRIKQLDNGWSRAAWALPSVHGEGRQNFCIQVTSEANNEVIYTLRIKGDSFTPPVRGDGTYHVRVFDPDGGYEKEYRGMKATRAGSREGIA